MRRTSLLLACLAAPWPLLAAERSAALPGARLSIDTPCAAHVDIHPDATLHGQVALTASADHQQELDQLMAEPGARIHAGPHGCWRPGKTGTFQPTLRLRLRVPLATPLVIAEAGAGLYTVGEVGGPLKLDFSGSAQLQSGAVAALTVSLSGSGDVTVSRVAGPIQLDLSGHGTVTLGSAKAATLTASIGGSGTLSVSAGRIDRAKLDLGGAGSMRFGATVGDAAVDLSGAGSIRFAAVTGRLTKEVSGLGSVTVGP